MGILCKPHDRATSSARATEVVATSWRRPSSASFSTTASHRCCLIVTVLVSLSGTHTFGVAHRPAFDDRFKDGIDMNPAIERTFATMLRNKCDKDKPRGTLKQNLDVRTPNIFDNKYYFDLVARQGLFKSDQGLFDHPTTKCMATRFSLNQDAFFEQFTKSMAKMVNMDLLTGDKGEIRARCTVRGTPPRIEAAATGNDEGISADM